MEVIRYLATLGFVIQVFLSDTGGLLSYAWTWNFGVIIAAILGCILAWRLHLQGLFSIAPFVYKKADLLELIQYSSWSMLAINATALLSQIDLQLLLLMRGTEEVGYYSNYISIFSIPFLFVMPIVGFMFPVVSAYFGANRLAEIRTIVTTFTRIFLTLSIPISGILLIYGSDLGTYFFGEKFARSGHILLFSAPFIVFNFLLQLNFVILGATGKIKERLRIVLIGIGVNLLLNIIFIYLYGAE